MKTTLSTNRPRTVSAAKALTAQEDEEEPARPIDPIVVEGTPEGPSDGGGWFEPGAGYGAGEPILVAETACEKTCANMYKALSMRCRRLLDARLKALCWAAAAADYGVCLAGC
jgi:hypothetical protein